MTKTNAGELKRTVTVVVGPRTVELMEELNTCLATMTGQEKQSLTDLAGAALNLALTAWRRAFLKEGLRVIVSHWD